MADESVKNPNKLKELTSFYEKRRKELENYYGVEKPPVVEEPEITPTAPSPESPLLTEEQIAAVRQDTEQEEKYGNRPIETAVGSALSSATFGLTDVAGRAIGGDEFAERRRELEDRNPGAAIAGDVTGVLGGVLLSGGTSLAAKGVSAGVKTASRMGKITEEAAKEFLKQFPNKKVAESVIGQATARAANWGVEGSLYGAGHLISDLSLDRVELNGESLLATVGSGAIWGAGMGGAAGAIGAAGKKALSSTKEASQKFLQRTSEGAGEIGVVAKARQKLAETFDPKVAAEEYSGLGLQEIEALKKSNPNFSQELVDYFKNTAKISELDTRKDVFLKNQKVLDLEGRQIGNIIEEISKDPLNSVNKTTLYDTAIKKLDDFIATDVKIGAPGSDKLIKQVRLAQESLRRNASKGQQVLTADNVQFIKRRADSLINWSTDNLEKEVPYQLRNVFKDAIDDIASKVGPEYSAALKTANKNYSLAKTLEDSLAAKASGNGLIIDKAVAMGLLGFGIYSPVGAAAAATYTFLKSDIKRAMIMNGNIQVAKDSVLNTINKGVSLFTRAKDATITGQKGMVGAGAKAFIPVTTTILLNSNLTKKDNEERRKLESPKTKQEAAENLVENVNRLVNDAEYFERKVLAKFYAMRDASPQTAEDLIVIMQRAMQFLNSKMPKESASSINTLFATKRTLSDSEMSKMARYLQVIENPLSTLDELNNGSLTRDHIEALKTVYPLIYEEIRTTAMEEVRKKPQMSYQKKVQLGILLDLSTDISLMPENVLKLQSIYATQPNQYAQQPNQFTSGNSAVQPTSGALQKLNFSGRAKTDVQRISEE